MRNSNLALKKKRILGITNHKARYDLPLHESAGTNFLMLLMALMTFLAMMALAATFILDGITTHWSSGLENRATIEIPALKPDETIRNADQIADLGKKAEAILKNNPNVKTFESLSTAQTNALISPWLGEGIALQDIPLPGLISIKLNIADEPQINLISKQLKEIAPDIRIDTHEDWLGDILRLAGSLRFIAALITLVIGTTTIIAVAGAIRSRMAEHKADIELLHLMGASDIYICQQLQRHALILALKGSTAGLIGGAVISMIFVLLSPKGTNALLPDFSLSSLQMLCLVSLPLIISVIAAQTARFTVLRVLAQMP